MNSIEKIISDIALKVLKSNPIYFPLTLFPSSLGLKPISVFLHQSDMLFRLIPRYPQRALIADEIGLGKTIEALLYARYLEDLGVVDKVLVVVPKILMDQWSTELQRGGVPKQKIFFIKREKIGILRERGYPEGYYLASIDLVKRPEYEAFIKDIDWDLIIVDEAHNLGIGTDREKFIKKLIAQNVDNLKPVLFLSATPHRGKTDDYLNRLSLLDPTLTSQRKNLDNSEFYQKTHNVLLYRRTKEVVNALEGERIFKPCNFYALAIEPTEAEREFSEKLERYLRLKVREFTKDYVHSPEALLAVIIRKRASSSPKAAINTFESILRGIQSKEFEEVKDEERIFDQAFSWDYSEIDYEEEFDRLIDRLAEKYSHVLGEDDIRIVRGLMELAYKIMSDDTKLKSTARILKNYLEKGQKVVIFTEYRDTQEYLKSELPKLLGIGEDEFETINGKDKERIEVIKQKLSEKDGKVKFLIATDVASEGLNLQVANVILNYEAPWSPIKLEQRMGRVWRIGQEREVDVFTTFMAVRADLDVLENLYGKLMRINEALSDVKPLIGERLTYAYRSKASYAGEFWTTERIEISEVEINGKKKSISEADLVLASIRGNLREFVSAFLKYAQQLNQEISRKRVYPVEKATEIKNSLVKIGGIEDEEVDWEIFEKALKALGNAVLKEDDRVYQSRDVVRLLKDRATGNTFKGNNIHSSYIIIPSKKQSVDFIACVKLWINGKKLLEFPAIYIGESKRVIYGVSAINYLTKLMEKGGIPEFTEHIDILKTYSLEIEKFKIQSKVKDIFREILFKSTDYEDYLIAKGLKTRKIWSKASKWETEVLFQVIQMEGIDEKEGASQPSEEEKRKTEEKAMDYAMDYERKQGRNPKDVSAKESFDILSIDPKTGENRYIEVKGHKNLIFYAELTHNEFKVAQEKGENYWLYLILNLEKQPVFLAFRNPLQTLRIHRKIEKIILGL